MISKTETNSGFPVPPKAPIVSGRMKVILFRMWVAGAVCFFAAWGRTGSLEAGSAYSVNLIAGIILFLVIADWIIVEPVLRMVIDKKSNTAKKKEKNIFRIGKGFLHIARITLIVLLIVATYYLVNNFIIYIFSLDEESVPVPLEPILFSILYGLYFLFFDIIKSFITGRLKPKINTEEV